MANARIGDVTDTVFARPDGPRMSNDLQPALGMAARAARKRLGLTQQQVADTLGVAVVYYGRIERGRALPSMSVFARLVSLLDVSADALLGTDNASVPEPAPLLRPDDPRQLRALVMRIAEASPRVVDLVHKAIVALDNAVREVAGRKPS